jgi:hypothetical protein
MEVPRWLKLQEQIDFLYFELSEIQRRMPKNSIDAAIDDATGFTSSYKKDIQRICKRMKKLKKAFAKETGQEINTEMEDKIIRVAGR